MGDELRERATLCREHPAQALQQLSVREMIEPPETTSVRHTGSVPHDFSSPALPRPRAIASGKPRKALFDLNALHAGARASRAGVFVRTAISERDSRPITSRAIAGLVHS